MTTITSAGAGSGIDLESVISASLAAKKTQLEQPITTKKTNTQITLSGISQLKSAISTFSSTLDSLTKTGAFNKRSVKVTQSTDDPVMTVTAKSGASNGQYNITVKQLATTSKLENTFDSSTTSLVNNDDGGSLTFTAGDQEFTVNVKKGDTLENIRNRINNSGNNFGLSANIIKTSDGKSKLVLDSGVSGDGNDMSITADTDELKSLFDTNIDPTTKTAANPDGTAYSQMELKQPAQSAIIDVDGNELTSDTNTFDDSIVGLKIEVNRLSDKDSSDNTGNTRLSNKVAITTDTASVKSLVQSFVDGYNTLMSKTTALGKRDTIVAGESQDDGGALAGDSTTRSISNILVNAISSQSKDSTTFSTIFQLGIKMDNDGKLSIDSDTFTDALDNNFDQVVALFGGENGVAKTLSSQLETYTKTGGLLAQREDSLNSDLRTLSQKESDNTDALTKYEANLRAQYGSLDTLLAKMNQSASYLSLISSS